jgi:hypothetical protein
MTRKYSSDYIVITSDEEKLNKQSKIWKLKLIKFKYNLNNKILSSD